MSHCITESRSEISGSMLEKFWCFTWYLLLLLLKSVYSTTLFQNGTGYSITDMTKYMLVPFKFFEVGFFYFLIILKMFSTQVGIIDEPLNTYLLNYVLGQVSLKEKWQNDLRSLQQLSHSLKKNKNS